jgi:hypothetical protein
MASASTAGSSLALSALARICGRLGMTTTEPLGDGGEFVA